MAGETWQRSIEFFATFARDEDRRGRMSAINLSLLEQARPRWESVLECHHVMGFGVVFSPPDAPYTQWVRLEPEPDHDGGPTVRISVITHRPFQSGSGSGSVVGGDSCFLPMATTVLESFLVQLAEPAD